MIIKTKVILTTYHFLIISLHLTIIYDLEIICLCYGGEYYIKLYYCMSLLESLGDIRLVA